ncbi:MAG: ribokinase [Sphingobium sp.]|jgi:ribokinase|nr:MAG: ribokinase [Sphingobium sp.]
MAVEILGSLNVDIILEVDALPRAGETVLAGGTARMPGGKGANQAVAAARMGARTAMAGAVGVDEHGQWMIGLLAQDGIDASAIRQLPGVPTGTAYIAVDRSGENQIIVSLGANAAFDRTMLAPPAPDIRVILAQLETPVPTLLARFASASCVRILNTAPAVPDIDALLALTDVIILNEHELQSYRSGGPGGRIGAARALLSREDQVAIVTLGGDGSLAVWPDRHLRVPAFPVSPIDTIGAGDCFCGALAAMLDDGASIETALPVASAAAAICTLSRGAAPAMPDRAAVEAFMHARPAVSPTEHAQAIKTPASAGIESGVSEGDR